MINKEEGRRECTYGLFTPFENNRWKSVTGWGQGVKTFRVTDLSQTTYRPHAATRKRKLEKSRPKRWWASFLDEMNRWMYTMKKSLKVFYTIKKMYITNLGHLKVPKKLKNPSKNRNPKTNEWMCLVLKKVGEKTNDLLGWNVFTQRRIVQSYRLCCARPCSI